MNVFIRTLHELMKSKSSTKFLITISPTCTFPNPYFGPEPNTILKDSVKFIDQVINYLLL